MGTLCIWYSHLIEVPLVEFFLYCIPITRHHEIIVLILTDIMEILLVSEFRNDNLINQINIDIGLGIVKNLRIRHDSSDYELIS